MLGTRYDYGINEPRMQDAIAEIKALVVSRYPDAVFDVFPSANVNGVYLRMIVDIEELGDVSDLVLPRVVEMQLDEELPIYPIPERPRRWSPAESDTGDIVVAVPPESLESHDAQH